MKKLYIFLFISSAVFTNTLFSMEDSTESSRPNVSIVTKLKAIVRRASFSSKDKNVITDTRTRSNSGSFPGINYRRWQMQAKLLAGTKYNNLTDSDIKEYLHELEHYCLLADVVSFRNVDLWNNDDEDLVRTLKELQTKIMTLLEERNTTFNSIFSNKTQTPKVERKASSNAIFISNKAQKEEK